MDYKEDPLSMFNEMMKKNELEFTRLYNESLSKTTNLLFQYSVKDILFALFPLSLWLGNISAPVKLKFVYMVFSSTKEDKYKKHDVIKNYDDFCDFAAKLINTLPDFPKLEDYYPEADWGEIKYFHNNIIYKMFYGSDLDGAYEFLQAYQIIHCSIDDIYNNILGRSPVLELEKCLSIQQTIIDSLEENVLPDINRVTHLGALEIPNKAFWENCKNFYNSIGVLNIPNYFIDNYSSKIGTIKKDTLEVDNFVCDYHEDKNYQYMIIEYGNSYYPILPRRFMSILIQSWGDLYFDNKHKLVEQDPNIRVKYNYKIYDYIHSRIGGKDIFSIVSPFDKDNNKPSDSVYSCSFISKEELYLVYLLDPEKNENEIEASIRNLEKQINDDLEILSNPPITLLLRLEKENNVIGFNSHNNSRTNIKPKILILISRLKISLGNIKISVNPSCEVILLEDFLGIMDEINSLDELSDFFNFSNSQKTILYQFNTLLDIYGAFKDSYGILYSGANNPTSISLNSNWGSGYRYKSLKEFWSCFPEVNFIGHPRTWIVKKNKKVVRLISKNIRMHVLYVKVAELNIFINAPFHEFNFEQTRVTDLVMQIIQDCLIKYNSLLSKHHFFNLYNKMQIFVYPHDIVINNEKLSYLKHLDPKDDLYKIEWGFPELSVPGIRISINYNRIYKELVETDNRKFEIELFKDVIEKINEINYDNIIEIINIINKDSNNKARFKINIFNKLASFPEYAEIILPDNNNFKHTVKSIAEIAFKCNVKEGEYNVSDAKNILNNLKKGLVEIINSKVSNLSFSESIGYLISKTDALTNKYEQEQMTYKESMKHDVDYIREERYAKNHQDYVKEHRNFRYLIEKLVQLRPSGINPLNIDGLKELLAYIDWLYVIQYASDNIHYGVTTAGIIVSNDFQVEVKYYDKIESKEKSYAEEDALIQLEIIGAPDDKVDSIRETSIFLEDLDRSFRSDFGFSLRDLSTVLDVLTFWTGYNEVIKEREYYKANIDELYKTTIVALTEGTIERSEFVKIIDFLTLKSEEMLKVFQSNSTHDDLPIWEHNKRPMRYNLRPLIKIKDEYFWGPYSTRVTKTVWLGSVSSAIFPYEITTKNIRDILDNERRNISKALNIKTEEIIKRYTTYSKRECELHKLNNSIPQDLGDYDVLAYLEDKQIILNIECKDIEPPFCLKDAKRLREKIFGRDDRDRGYFEKVIKRESYLKENPQQIIRLLKWKLNTTIPVKVFSIFIIRRNYWWTKYPPYDTDVIFLRVDLLDNFINNLLKSGK